MPDTKELTTNNEVWKNDDLITRSLETGEALLDDNKQSWNKLIKQLLPTSSKVIALRGAGSWNGMDKDEADNLLKNKLIPKIAAQLNQPGLVVIMHDGDYDDLAKPDLGYIAGRLLDHFGNNTNRVVFIVAQKESWHPDEIKGQNLRNTRGLQYVTYLFPDNTHPNDHSSFTQDETLVSSNKYEQWYIGASGKIATSQLTDYDSKVPKGTTRKAIFYRVGNNTNLDQELQAKITTAEKEGNTKLADTLQSRVEQRKRKYGTHWNNDGLPDINSKDYPHLQLEFIH